jgi:hypothetical protein
MMSAPYVARCSICGIAPFSENDRRGLGYTLKRFPDGKLYCVDHQPPKTRVSRLSPVSPRATLDELENTFTAQIEMLNGAIAGAVENAIANAIEALTGKAIEALTEEQRAVVEGIVDEESARDSVFAEFRKEVERGFATLRKALEAQAQREDKAARGTRPKLPTLAGDHESQGDLTADGEAES